MLPSILHCLSMQPSCDVSHHLFGIKTPFPISCSFRELLSPPSEDYQTHYKSCNLPRCETAEAAFQGRRALLSSGSAGQELNLEASLRNE